MSGLVAVDALLAVSLDDMQPLGKCTEAGMIYLYVERARMTRGIAMLVVWTLLQAPSALASTRQNRAYEDLRRKYETALQEIERLRNELAVLKGERTAAPAPTAGGAEAPPGEDLLQTGNTHFRAQRDTEVPAD